MPVWISEAWFHLGAGKEFSKIGFCYNSTSNSSMLLEAPQLLATSGRQDHQVGTIPV
jgi:hypothetical protein